MDEWMHLWMDGWMHISLLYGWMELHHPTVSKASENANVFKRYLNVLKPIKCLHAKMRVNNNYIQVEECDMHCLS